MGADTTVSTKVSYDRRGVGQGSRDTSPDILGTGEILSHSEDNLLVGLQSETEAEDLTRNWNLSPQRES